MDDDYRQTAPAQISEDEWRDKLTPEEFRVTRLKGTERPFTGTYWDCTDSGSYRCTCCGAPLFDAEHKFDAGCGWPSFDNEIDGAVTRIPDPDGRRTEIVCTACGAHLGHVFIGEGMTLKNERHCVNSISLTFEGKTKDADMVIK